MTERDALLRAIFENPEDDAPRLAYADWLEDHADPLQAEFVRAQVAEAAFGPDTERGREMAGRAVEAWKAISRWHTCRPTGPP